MERMTLYKTVIFLKLMFLTCIFTGKKNKAKKILFVVVAGGLMCCPGEHDGDAE